MKALGSFQANELHSHTTIMPILPNFLIHIFSDSYEFDRFFDGQNVTNVVKKGVKKLSVGEIFAVDSEA